MSEGGDERGGVVGVWGGRGAGGGSKDADPISEEDEAWKQELRELGHSEADIEAAFAVRDAGQPAPDAAPESLEIWPENEPAVTAFQALETQWRYHPTAGTHTGLIWSSVDRIVRDLGFKKRRAVRADVRLMELAALDEMRKQEREARVRAAGQAQEI